MLQQQSTASILIPRSTPNRGDPESANPSSRSPASKTEGQKGYQQVAERE